MKNFVLLISFNLIYISITAQIDDKGDKVGIGTSNPNAKLEIVENSGTDGVGLRLTNSSWASYMATSLEFKTGGKKSVPTSKISSIMNGAGNAGDRLGFFVQNNGTNPNNNSLVEKLSLLPNGDVGVGTSNPSAKLEIVKNSGTDAVGLRLTNSSWASHMATSLEFKTGGKKSVPTSKISSIMNGAGNAGDRLGFFVQNNGTNPNNNSLVEKLSLLPNGDVGVGTSNPNAKLEIVKNSGTDAVGLRLTNSSWTSNMATSLEFKTGGKKSVPTSKISSIMNGAGNAGDRLGFFVQNNGTNPNNNSLVEKLSLLPNGDVGIGTINPNGWKLAVNGKIRAKEIKVETNNWPDFVFEKNYLLPTLKEVENHINVKGHLKNIPSAKEIEENGVLLGDMNSKLLQKIEELTLYTIQQQKEIEKLKSTLKKIISENKKL